MSVRYITNTIISYFILITCFSCVSPKVHNELQDSYDNVLNENQILKTTSDRAKTNLKEISSDMEVLEIDIQGLIQDSIKNWNEIFRNKGFFQSQFSCKYSDCLLYTSDAADE